MATADHPDEIRVTFSFANAADRDSFAEYLSQHPVEGVRIVKPDQDADA